MNAVPQTAIPNISTGHPLSGSPQPAVRRRRRRRSGLGQLSVVAVLVAAAAVPVGYVAFCARATQHCYQHTRLHSRLHRVQVERKILEAQVAELERLDRVLYEAKQLGMQPRQALQYVALAPKQPAVREFRQASARP